MKRRWVRGEGGALCIAHASAATEPKLLLSAEQAPCLPSGRLSLNHSPLPRCPDYQPQLLNQLLPLPSPSLTSCGREPLNGGDGQYAFLLMLSPGTRWMEQGTTSKPTCACGAGAGGRKWEASEPLVGKLVLAVHAVCSGSLAHFAGHDAGKVSKSPVPRQALHSAIPTRSHNVKHLLWRLQLVYSLVWIGGQHGPNSFSKQYRFNRAATSCSAHQD